MGMTLWGRFTSVKGLFHRCVQDLRVPAELRSRSLKTTRWNVRHLAPVPCVAVTVGAPEGDLRPSQSARELVSRSQRASSPDRARQKLSPPTVFPARSRCAVRPAGQRLTPARTAATADR